MKEQVMKTNESQEKQNEQSLKTKEIKEIWTNDKENQRKTKRIVETQMKTNEEKYENHRKTTAKPKKTQENNNDKQRTTHENYWEPQKNQRKNNEKQWKTKDNFASILNYFFAGTFCHCFFEFFICNGERNKR